MTNIFKELVHVLVKLDSRDTAIDRITLSVLQVSEDRIKDFLRTAEMLQVQGLADGRANTQRIAAAAANAVIWQFFSFPLKRKLRPL